MMAMSMRNSAKDAATAMVFFMIDSEAYSMPVTSAAWRMTMLKSIGSVMTPDFKLRSSRVIFVGS